MSSQSVSLGRNRTGIGTSPTDAARMVEGTREFPADGVGNERGISDVRELFAEQSEPIGTLPPPPTVKGMVSTAVEAVKGTKPTQLIDKLGERLAFERTGVRLYEALISKYNVYGSFPGGPELLHLEKAMREEYEQFLLLTQVLAKLGADPTVMTPSADLQATITKGALEVMVDPRTTFVQCLEAALVAELADNDCWETLIELVRATGDEETVDAFERALAEEAVHLEDVRAWLTAAQGRSAAE